MQANLPQLPEHIQLTLFQLLERYTGPEAKPVPAELAEWVELAQQWAEVLELRSRNDIREAELTLARLERLRSR